jgi:hypothetical protein
VRTRHRIAGLAALAVTAAPFSPGFAAAGRARPTVISHCLAAETILYSGRFARAVGSVCLAGARLHYRYGPPGRPEIDLVSAADWSNVHYGRVIGGGGGYQDHVRFTVGTQNYVIFEGLAGNLTDIPGQRWSGIYVGPDSGAGTTLAARGRAFVAAGWTDAFLSQLPAALRENDGLREEQDGPWDAWF